MLIDKEELFTSAREYFTKGHYKVAEPMIQQLMILENRNPELYYMYGTILYDQGKLKKAIETFKKALEIDPGFTDAGIGLSIILNDLGKYEEAKTIFEESYAIMKQKETQQSPYINSKLSQKHAELGELYYLYKRYTEGLKEYQKAFELNKTEVPYGLQVVEGYLCVGQHEAALEEMKSLTYEFPENIDVKLKLAQMYFQNGQSSRAQDELESILLIDPENKLAGEQLAVIKSQTAQEQEPEGDFRWQN